MQSKTRQKEQHLNSLSDDDLKAVKEKQVTVLVGQKSIDFHTPTKIKIIVDGLEYVINVASDGIYIGGDDDESDGLVLKYCHHKDYGPENEDEDEDPFADSFMKPEIVNGTFYVDKGDRGEGNLMPDPPIGCEEYETWTGWFGRLSAPWYLDCTDWDGPFDSEKEARDYLRQAYGDD